MPDEIVFFLPPLPSRKTETQEKQGLENKMLLGYAATRLTQPT